MYSIFQPVAYSIAGLAREIIAQGFSQPGRPFYGPLPADKVNFFLCSFPRYLSLLCFNRVSGIVQILVGQSPQRLQATFKNDVMPRS